MDFNLSRASLSIGSLDVLCATQMHHHFAPHMHEFFALGLIDDGASHVRYRGCNASARAGALVTISAGEVHTGGPVADCGWSYRMIYPQPGLLRLALEDTIDENESVLFRSAFIDDRDARDAFDVMYGSLLGGNCELAAEEAVLHFLRLLALKHSSRPPRLPLAARKRVVVETARDYLEAHFAERVHLSALAGTCGVSPFHLIRVFRRAVGVPPHAYLKQLRVARAMVMLQEGKSLARIAYACGFSDQSHLTRAFKSTHGFPPGAYQRALRNLPFPTLALHDG